MVLKRSAPGPTEPGARTGHKLVRKPRWCSRDLPLAPHWHTGTKLALHHNEKCDAHPVLVRQVW
jgi:hypothetical protein